MRSVYRDMKTLQSSSGPSAPVEPLASFFPELVAFRFRHCSDVPCDFSFLQSLLRSSSVALRDVELGGAGLTPQHVLAIGVVPNIRSWRAGEELEAVQRARKRTSELLRMPETREPRDVGVRGTDILSELFTPQQADQLKRRLLCRDPVDDVLNPAEWHADMVREAFFTQLRNELEVSAVPSQSLTQLPSAHII